VFTHQPTTPVGPLQKINLPSKNVTNSFPTVMETPTQRKDTLQDTEQRKISNLMTEQEQMVMQRLNSEKPSSAIGGIRSPNYGLDNTKGF